MIQGVGLSPRFVHEDGRGRTLRMMRPDDPEFQGFGEVYFSTVRPGAVKAWKLHTRMTSSLAVPAGSVLFVLYDDRPGSPTRGVVQTEILGGDDYRLLQVPPGVWLGFQGAGQGESVVANLASIPHDPAEAATLPPDSPEIPYTWSARP
jgi:dTDP-4-dehydrorhamnose 3,5-epimerase